MKKIEQISTFNENNKTTTTSVCEAGKYSEISRGPRDFRGIMQEARNEEKVQEKDQENRLNNFIIHGLDEKGKTIDEKPLKKLRKMTRELSLISYPKLALYAIPKA